MVKFKVFFVALLVQISCASVFAQSSTDDYNLAVDVLKGKNDCKTMHWAINALEHLTDSTLKPKALNALGMAYANGIGVETDTLIAIAKFENSAKSGYSHAYHNMGLLYKNAVGCKQDFERALTCFENGAKCGSELCMYDAGYMYFKGFGCSQDYNKAVAFFEQGISYDNSACMYMLGICYRNGYGVLRNEDSARYYLKKSAFYNYRSAKEELKRNSPEYIEDYFIDSINVDEVEFIENLSFFESDKITKKTLMGEFDGELVTFDWSGKHIINKEKLKLCVTDSDSLNGVWIQGKDTLIFCATLDDDSNVVFKNFYVMLNERYYDASKVKCQFKDLRLKLIDDNLVGKLNVFSLLFNEPERPKYVALKKIADKDPSAEKAIKIVAIPRSLSSVQIDFSLPFDVDGVNITIYNKMGVLVRSSNCAAMKSGDNSLLVNHNLPSGTYIITVKAGNCQGSTIITY